MSTVVAASAWCHSLPASYPLQDTTAFLAELLLIASHVHQGLSALKGHLVLLHVHLGLSTLSMARSPARLACNALLGHGAHRAPWMLLTSVPLVRICRVCVSISSICKQSVLLLLFVSFLKATTVRWGPATLRRAQAGDSVAPAPDWLTRRSASIAQLVRTAQAMAAHSQ